MNSPMDPSSWKKVPEGDLWFPHVIDSTMLAIFRACPHKFRRLYMEHWKPKEESVHLVAGKAFAAGVEAARLAFYVAGKTRPEAEAFGLGALLEAYGDYGPPIDSPKSASRMAGALEFYFEAYPLGDDGTEPIRIGSQHGIEFSFAEPLPISHPLTGDPIIYAGRSDMIAHFAGGTYVFDEKTTSSLGGSWSRQWDLRSQFSAYCWAAHKVGIEVAGVVVRGVSILKTKYDTAQAITYRAPWEIERWLNQTCADVVRIRECWESGYWDYNLDSSCTHYGGCSLAQVCKSKNPEDWLPMSFERRLWDPLAREEVVTPSVTL